MKSKPHKRQAYVRIVCVLMMRCNVRLFHNIMTARARTVLILLVCHFHALTAEEIIVRDTVMQGKEIPEVVVTGREIVVKDDKLIINLSSKIKRHSFDGYSALSLLSIPGLGVDPIDGTVTTNGQATMLCINGREATKNEIRTLYPKDIIRIDYYQRHDPNHPMATSVIDFILRIRENGGIATAQANQNLNKAAGDGMLDWKMFCKKSQFNIQLTGKYLHFSPDRGTETYTLMPFLDGDVEKNVTTMPSDIHANGGGVRLAYMFNGKKSKLQIAASLRGNHDAKETLQEQTVSDIGKIDTKDFRHNDNLSPTLKIYYKRSFNKKTSLETVVDASYNHTRQWRDYQAFDTYLSEAEEDYYFFRPQMTLTHKLGKRANLFACMTYRYAHSDNIYIENGTPAANSLTEGQAIIMPGCNLQVIPGKLRLTLQLQERIQTIDAGKDSYTRTYLTPSVIYQIALGKKTMLDGAFFTGVNSPDMKYYNSGEKRIDEYQLLAGNSEHDMGRLFSANISLNSFHKWGGIQLFSQYDHNGKEIYEDIFCDDVRRLYVHQFRNGGTYERCAVYGELMLKILPDKLKWSNSIQYTHTKQRIGYLNTLDAWNASSELTYYDKGWQCKLLYMTGRKTLDSAGGIAKRPQQLSLHLGYAAGDWSFALSLKNPGMTSPSRTELRRDGYVRLTDTYSPRTDCNMFAVRVSYRFVYGKKHKYQDVQMDDKPRSAILDTETR